MSRENELAVVRDQVSIVAEQVARLLDVIAVRASRGWDVRPYEERLALLETMMWKLHQRHGRLKRAPDGAVLNGRATARPAQRSM